MNNIKLIESYLDDLYSNPKCELDYNKDYELLISVVLSAQTTDKKVNIVSKRLWDKYENLEGLSKANKDDICDILRVLGTFNRKADYIIEIANILVNNYEGHVPNDRKILESLPGVGRKTANVVMSNLFDYPAIAVDTHVSRVSKRLGLANDDDDVLTIENKLMKIYDKSVWSRRHHQMVLFGRYNCKAINPNCDECKLKNICKKKS